MAPTNRNAAQIITTWNGRERLIVCLPPVTLVMKLYIETVT
jgi:hypothetical protein